MLPLMKSIFPDCLHRLRKEILLLNKCSFRGSPLALSLSHLGAGHHNGLPEIAPIAQIRVPGYRF
jgi:hypothetical protein